MNSAYLEKPCQSKLAQNLGSFHFFKYTPVKFVLKSVRCVSNFLSVLLDGRSVVFSLKTDIPLHYFSFKFPVTSIVYSPDGR